jgi:formimidoylglutamate deiminase
VRIFEADWTWTGQRFEEGVRLAVGPDGRFAAIGRLAEEPHERLAGLALVPGFVNAHSHAFQRGLRGHGETFPAGAGSFWSWREAMYRLVEALDERVLETLTRRAFSEMLAAGITAVGEFHYVHHAPGHADFALDRAVLAAARATGIRLVLLNVYYRTGAIGKPLAGAQARFDGRSLAVYWKNHEALARELDPARESLGVAPHSIRAVPLDELTPLVREARARGLAVHMHVEETRKEIEDCRAALGRAPLELLLDAGLPDAGFTAVHGTHSTRADLARLAERGANLCLCPLTEANLGDGLPKLVEPPGQALALGTDSNARISMLEEMRWGEYGQRLRGEKRGGVLDAHGAVAPRWLRAATEGGARALGLAAGRFEAGCHADWVALDLGAPELAGWTPGTLAESLLVGAGERVLAGTWVGGRRVV